MNTVAAGSVTDPALVLVLSLASLATAVLAGLGVAVFLRRRSRSYLLVAVALVGLLARTAVALLATLNLLSHAPHHLVEHGLDTIVALLLVGAVYYAQPVRRLQAVTSRRADE